MPDYDIIDEAAPTAIRPPPGRPPAPPSIPIRSSAPPPRAPSPDRRRRWLKWALVALLVLLGAGAVIAGYLLLKPSGPPSAGGVEAQPGSAEEPRECRVDSRRARLHREPNGAVVGPLVRGQTVAVLAEREGWARIRAGEADGWVEISRLRCDAERATGSRRHRSRRRSAPKTVPGRAGGPSGPSGAPPAFSP